MRRVEYGNSYSTIILLLVRDEYGKEIKREIEYHLQDNDEVWYIEKNGFITNLLPKNNEIKKK